MLLSREKLATYLQCPRRFQLRYLDGLTWPIPTADSSSERPLRLGQAFHQMVHRHFLGFPIAEDLENQPELLLWWRRFLGNWSEFPSGRVHPELTLTVPIGRHQLTGRFDLVVVSPGSMKLYDWKTDRRVPSVSELREDLQTKVYLALAAEGGSALGYSLRPEQISLTYWYVTAPDAPVTIAYTETAHHRSWSFLTVLAEQVGSRNDFPLTDDLSHCRRCLYQIVCRRVSDQWVPDLSTIEEEVALEPDIP